MSTYIGNREIRRSEVLALIAEEAEVKPQGHQEPFGAFARRINKAFPSTEEATEVADLCLARWLQRRRTDVGPLARPNIRPKPNVEKVQMHTERDSGHGEDTVLNFLAWLTTRDEEVFLGAYHDATIAAELLKEWHQELEARVDNIDEEATPPFVGDDDHAKTGIEPPKEPTTEELSSTGGEEGETNPFEEGRNAAGQELAGKPIIPNPYEEDSLHAMEWQRGHDSMKSS